MKIVTSHPGGGRGANDTWGGGSKIGPTSVTYYLNGPL